MVRRHYPVLARVSPSYSEPLGRFPRVTHPCATSPEGLVRLACVRHAASVRSEPESNSQVDVRQARRGMATRKPASLGAVPAQITNWCVCVLDIWNGFNFPIVRHPEATGDRGRRPHVPSSKPTMSKSRRLSLPDGPGYRLAVERGANGVGQRPCPVGEAPYMEAQAYRQWLFSEK